MKSKVDMISRRNMRNKYYSKLRKGIICILLLGGILVLFSTNLDAPVNKSELLGNDYRLFQDTPAWELAKAVCRCDIDEIDKITDKNPDLINYRDPVFGQTFLTLIIHSQNFGYFRLFGNRYIIVPYLYGKNNFETFKFLIEKGADINIHSTYSGSSPIMDACKYNFYHMKYIQCLLESGANPNDVISEDKVQEGPCSSVLRTAIASGEKDFVEILLNHGAILDGVSDCWRTDLGESLILEEYDIALLLLKHGADYKGPVSYTLKGEDTIPTRPQYIQEYIYIERDEDQSWMYNFIDDITRGRKIKKIQEFIRNDSILHKK